MDEHEEIIGCDDPENFRVIVSRGSSLEKIQASLRSLQRVEFAVTCSFDVLLHHGCSHLELLRDCGVAESDMVVIGNLSLGVGLFEYKGRNACVRFKASLAELSLLRGANKAIDQFLKPLAESVRAAQG